MTALGPTTGQDGVIASGNVPTWIVQASEVHEPLTTQSKTFSADLLAAETTARIDCLHDMGDVSFTRNLTTRDRKRACEKVTSKIKTGETIEGTITAVYNQQADAKDPVNAAYTALPEGATVYVVIAYGWDSAKPPTETTKVDIYRGKVQQRAKNVPVEGEALEFTATIASDLFLEDVTLGKGEIA